MFQKSIKTQGFRHQFEQLRIQKCTKKLAEASRGHESPDCGPKTGPKWPNTFPKNLVFEPLLYPLVNPVRLHRSKCDRAIVTPPYGSLLMPPEDSLEPPGASLGLPEAFWGFPGPSWAAWISKIVQKLSGKMPKT